MHASCLIHTCTNTHTFTHTRASARTHARTHTRPASLVRRLTRMRMSSDSTHICSHTRTQVPHSVRRVPLLRRAAHSARASTCRLIGTPTDDPVSTPGEAAIRPCQRASDGSRRWNGGRTVTLGGLTQPLHSPEWACYQTVYAIKQRAATATGTQTAPRRGDRAAPTRPAAARTAGRIT